MKKNTLAFASLLGFGLAIPGFSSTATVTLIFNGNTGTTNGITASTGSSGAITALEANFATDLVISGAPDSADNGTWNVNATLTDSYNSSSKTSTLTLSGTVGTCQTGCTGGNLDSVGGTLLTLVYNGSNPTDNPLGTFTSGSPSAGQYDASSGGFGLVFGTPTTLTDGSGLTSLLSALELGGPTVTLPSGDSYVDTGSASNGSSPFNYTADSQSFELSASGAPAPTPEPASALIFASGFIGLSWLMRRRYSQKLN